ncbi:MAG TPA: tRNA (guanosine(46)-N7)-methyltransferase TrmB [Burkholderiaceae bacterium]|nr:tRNA (guanosine(46)-N7)-methyltransferase TrmB [Burkholderiaceae bacterium]
MGGSKVHEVTSVVAVPHLKTIKSFVRRAGRITTGQSKAFEDLGEQFLWAYDDQVNLIDAINNIAHQAINTPDTAKNDHISVANGVRPIIFEIGFGMGEATAHIAALLPQTRFIACEVHQPGVGALLKRIGESLDTPHPIDNIRIISHDAVEVIDNMLPINSLDGVHIFFPDPWHKKRHNKRRLIQPPLIAKLAARLKVGGYIHCATDWQPYAEQILEVMRAEPLLKNRADPIADADLAGYSRKPNYRPLTKFENRGIKLGHGVWDVVFERI